jgi:hypothetical protein
VLAGIRAGPGMGGERLETETLLAKLRRLRDRSDYPLQLFLMAAWGVADSGRTPEAMACPEEEWAPSRFTDGLTGNGRPGYGYRE